MPTALLLLVSLFGADPLPPEKVASAEHGLALLRASLVKTMTNTRSAISYVLCTNMDAFKIAVKAKDKVDQVHILEASLWYAEVLKRHDVKPLACKSPILKHFEDHCLENLDECDSNDAQAEGITPRLEDGATWFTAEQAPWFADL